MVDDTRMVVNIDVINVMNRPTVPNATSLVMGYVNMESDEFLCRRAVFPPDTLLFFCNLQERMPRTFLRI